MAALKDGVTDAKKHEIVEALLALRKKFPQIQAGENLGWYEPKVHITLTADFNGRDDWAAFLNSPEHTNIVKNYLDCYDPNLIFTSQFELV